MARAGTGARASVAEVPAIGEARGLNRRADVGRDGREAHRLGRRRPDVGAVRLTVGGTSLTVTTTELLLETLLASVTVTVAVSLPGFA